MKVFLKTLLAILVAIVIAGAIFLTNLIWFRPWSLNLVYEKTFVEVIFNEPELLISLGLVAINNAVYPSYQKLIDSFKGVLPKTTTDDGVWTLPNGDAYYTYALRENTTTTLNPNELHELGLR
ncbi:MAG: hypothetical protein DME38_11295 [Verrucomicrobia bacterium]|nr:MAG: hypothetical protein DME38_11295 [Verrucomicrobiota bacterium]